MVPITCLVGTRCPSGRTLRSAVSNTFGPSGGARQFEITSSVLVAVRYSNLVRRLARFVGIVCCFQVSVRRGSDAWSVGLVICAVVPSAGFITL